MPQSKAKATTLQPSLDGNKIAIIREDSSVMVLKDSDSEILYSLLACVEDDAQSWKDFQLDWPRSIASSDAVENIDELPWEEQTVEGLVAELAEISKDPATSNWLVIDISHATILAGATAPNLVVATEGYALSSRDDATAELELAPWWRVERNADPLVLVAANRYSPVRRGPDRKVLWGDEWIEFLGQTLGDLAKTNTAAFEKRRENETVCRIHKAWLMTPRASLNHQTPREQIHIATDWISQLARTQMSRIEADLEPIPLPQSFSSFSNAPFGKHEIIIYFEANRALLAYGVQWVLKNISSRKSKNFARSVSEALRKYLHRWMEELDEESLTPALVVQFERQRLPLMALEVNHPEVCSCPICLVMANGAFWAGYIFYDGHQLELDGEFAFSLCSTREEWELENGFDDEEDVLDEADSLDEENSFDGEFEAKYAPPGAEQEVEDGADFDARIWKTLTPEEALLPHSLKTKLGLSFLFAELMSEVDSISKLEKNLQEDLEVMAHRVAHLTLALESKDRDKAHKDAASIKEIMEKFAEEFPVLVPRVADLTSRIDEELRAARG